MGIRPRRLGGKRKRKENWREKGISRQNTEDVYKIKLGGEKIGMTNMVSTRGEIYIWGPLKKNFETTKGGPD